MSCGLSWSGETQLEMVRMKDHFTPQERSDEEAQRQPLEEFVYEKAGSWAFS